MRRLLLALLLAVPLASCSLAQLANGVAPAPSVLAERTTVDERVALGVEVAYSGWVTFVRTGVELGLIRGSNAAKAQEWDNRIYDAVLVARRAYDTGNSDDYVVASANATSLISQAMAAFRPGAPT